MYKTGLNIEIFFFSSSNPTQRPSMLIPLCIISYFFMFYSWDASWGKRHLSQGGKLNRRLFPKGLYVQDKGEPKHNPHSPLSKSKGKLGEDTDTMTMAWSSCGKKK